MRFLEGRSSFFFLGLLFRSVEGAPKNAVGNVQQVTNGGAAAPLSTHIGRHLKHAAPSHAKAAETPALSYEEKLQSVEAELLSKEKELKVQTQLAKEKEIAATEAQ